MYRRLLVFTCKLLIKVLRLLGKNGSALPGLIIEGLYPDFLDKSLTSVQQKIILVTGTNGKTTTTKMLVAALRGTGARVVTNATGSNMTRGLIAALIEDMSYFGIIKPTDWFVFEMDEAYAPIFTNNISPMMVVALNVLRDQLDRYGEIDKTAQLIKRAALKAKTFIYNELDPLLAGVAVQLRENSVVTRSFGASKDLLKNISNEQTLHGESVITELETPSTEVVSVEAALDTQLIALRTGDEMVKLQIPVKGFHNVLNAAAVISVLNELVPERLAQAKAAIEHMPVPFGRGEKLHIRGKSITVALVKNPSGFASNLETFVKQANPEVVVFVVNDKFADGRDMSWLWDVSFKDAIPKSATIFTSGTRGYDIAVRLKHDGIESNTLTSIPKIIQLLMKSNYKNVVIIPTYTALFEVRTALKRYGKVPRIW